VSFMWQVPRRRHRRALCWRLLGFPAEVGGLGALGPFKGFEGPPSGSTQ